MKILRLVGCLLVFVPTCAVLGGLTWFDSPMPGGPLPRMFIDGLVGVGLGLVFGGVRGKWIDFVYGEEQPGDEYDDEPNNSL